MWTGIQNFFNHEAWPFIEALFHVIQMDVIAKLAPLAETAVEEVALELPLLATSPETFLKAFNATVAKLYEAAVGAGIDVAEHDLITAAQAALVNARAKIATTASK
jgi:hypothetical protein